MVDVSTMPFIPNSVTELAVDADGHFAEFAFGNAHMVLLYPENSTGFDLRTGDTVTISLDADARGSLGFGLFKDGIYVSEEVVSAQGLSKSKKTGGTAFSWRTAARACISAQTAL